MGEYVGVGVFSRRAWLTWLRMAWGSTHVGWRCRSLWSEGVVRGGGGALKSRRRWKL